MKLRWLLKWLPNQLNEMENVMYFANYAYNMSPKSVVTWRWSYPNYILTVNGKEIRLLNAGEFTFTEHNKQWTEFTKALSR